MKWSAERHDATTAHESRQTHSYVHHLSNYTTFVQSSAEQRLRYGLHIRQSWLDSREGQKIFLFSSVQTG
jgi:hypothetical protein